MRCRFDLRVAWFIRSYNTSFMFERMKIIDSKGCFSIMLFRPSCVCVCTRRESTRQSYYIISDGKTYSEGCVAPVYTVSCIYSVGGGNNPQEIVRARISDCVLAYYV